MARPANLHQQENPLAAEYRAVLDGRSPMRGLERLANPLGGLPVHAGMDHHSAFRQSFIFPLSKEPPVSKLNLTLSIFCAVLKWNTGAVSLPL